MSCANGASYQVRPCANGLASTGSCGCHCRCRKRANPRTNCASDRHAAKSHCPHYRLHHSRLLRYCQMCLLLLRRHFRHCRWWRDPVRLGIVPEPEPSIRGADWIDKCCRDRRPTLWGCRMAELLHLNLVADVSADCSTDPASNPICPAALKSLWPTCTSLWWLFPH